MLSHRTQKVLEALRASPGGGRIKTPDGHVWAGVHLAEAQPPNVIKHAWASHLAALTAEGFYKPGDDDFGAVRLTD